MARRQEIYEIVDLVFENDGRGNRAEKGDAVNDLNNEVSRFLTQASADYLSSIPEGELRRISCDMGLGSRERGREKGAYRTYKELRRTCKPAPRQLEAGR